MRRALALARRMVGRTSPNPAVGCVIVRGGDAEIVGQGATAVGGRPHAEAVALAGRARRRAARPPTYRSSPAHIRDAPRRARARWSTAGVRRVVIGCIDPYPPVRGRGVAILRAAGIEVVSGVLEDECRRLNQGFITRVTRGRPLATLKLALSLDGRIAAASGDSQWISSRGVARAGPSMAQRGRRGDGRRGDRVGGQSAPDLQNRRAAATRCES